MELHKGSLEVESEPGQGSTFTVVLQLGSAARQSVPTESRVLRALASATTGPARILVVEDNPVNQKVLTTILQKQGYQITTANDGVEALQALGRESFGLVLMDVQMPEMDGITAAKAIRRNPAWKDLPIIAITAHAMNGDRERCLQAGMTGYISKPVAPHHLIEAVRDQLDGKIQRLDSTTTMAALASVGMPDPIDKEMAARLMGNDTELMNGMTMLFLQLAPERMQKIGSAVTRLDTFAIRSHAGKLCTAAERIAAMEVANRARQLADAAPEIDYEELQDRLNSLDREMRRLDRHVRIREKKSGEMPAIDIQPAGSSAGSSAG